MEHFQTAPSVVLADDHHFFREGLRGMLDAAGVRVVGEASDSAGAVELARRLKPDIVLIDLRMPDEPGIEAVREIVASCPDTRTVVLTVSSEETDVLEAMAAGACGYLLKDARADELAAAVRLAAAGHAVLAQQVADTLIAQVHQRRRAAAQAVEDGSALTARELEVIRLIAEGADNAQIGRELSISRHTVKQYVTNIFQKLGVASRVEAAVDAVRKGLV